MKYIHIGVVAIIGFLLLSLLDNYYTHTWQEQREEELSNRADLVQIRLQNTLQSRINATHYIKSLFQLHPDTTVDEFSKFAQSMIESTPALRALQFADKSTQVVYVYPPKGNEVTIRDPMVLLQDPVRAQYVQKSIEEKRMTVQPPFELRQGGLGLIVRNPIFISGELIGIAIAVLDAPAVIDAAWPDTEKSPFVYSLTDSEGHTFYNSLHAEDASEQRRISFADAEWLLQVSYKHATTAHRRSDQLIILGLGSTVLIVLLTFIWFLNHRNDFMQKKVYEKTKRLHASERRFRIVADYTVDWEYWVSPQGTLLYNSPSFEQITGYPVSAVTNHQDILELVHSDDTAVFSEHIHAPEHRPRPPIEFRIHTKTGTVKWIGHSCQPVYDTEENFLGIRVSNRDITAQKALEKKLENLVQEKDYLMTELNHRVKNNLMMINSLIKLKSGSLGERVDLSDIMHQIDTIRIVHEKLYKTATVTQIDFREYAEELLKTVFSFSNRPVEIKAHIHIGKISTKKTIPLGLIINEIATNAMKHGFKPDEPAVFSIRMKEENGECVLTLSNSGNPFPEEVDVDTTDTLGLRLIDILSTQLGGSLTLVKSPQPVYTLQFPTSDELQ